MSEERGCGFGFNNDIIWIIIAIVLICCFCPGIFGGCGGGYKC